MTIKVNKYRSLIFFVLLLLQFLTGSTLAAGIATMNYKDAFDQRAIQQKFPALMREWGCEDNVFTVPSDAVAVPITPQGYAPVASAGAGAEDLSKEAYEKACLAKLSSERVWAIAQPGINGAISIGMMAGGTALAGLLGGPDSMGSSVGIFATIANSSGPVIDIFQGIRAYRNQTADSLYALENTFAKQQCFIPRALWPIITEKFMIARTNTYEQRKAMEFLEFTLGLTVYAPKPPVKLKDGVRDIDHALSILSQKVDEFFADYVPFPEIHALKVNIRRFILRLNSGTENPRHVYLHGVGGIGKTHFANFLNDQINDLFPGSVRPEKIVITSPEELEGTADRPGAFLKVLRNQCAAKKAGSVVLMDEANWLRDDSFNAPAKRVFNGALSKLQTEYFGMGIDVDGISTPPTLALLAGNEEITDAPLKSRFDIVHYPMPTRDALNKHTLKEIRKVARDYNIRDLFAGSDLTARYSGELNPLLETWLTFRDIEANIPPLMNKWHEDQHRLASGGAVVSGAGAL